ncbi:MAG: hypothetical protein AAF652_16155 [Cyanobacteria bacterium P01_C01_bin.72]
MNTQTFADRSQQILFALLTVATVSTISSPAQADDALIQESIQESVVTGEDNISVQNSSQSNRQFTEYRDRYGRYGYGRGDGESSSTGIVQRSDQYCDQVGAANTCVQDAQQSNSSRTSRNRRVRRRSRY